MKENLYAEIYRNLDTNNVEVVAKEFGVSNEILQAILSLKLVRRSKKMHQRIKKKASVIHLKWKNGGQLLRISSELDFSPVIIASFIMREEGISKNGFRRMLENPREIKDKRLRREISEVVKQDFLYSPKAHDAQRERGKIGEKIIEKWLVDRGVDFVTEEEGKYNKTPDFVLEKPLLFEGKDISWIESKAVFCDNAEHMRYTKKQFADYIDAFGEGMVVYWYGFVDSIAKVEPRILIKDYTFFNDPLVKKLFALMK